MDVVTRTIVRTEYGNLVTFDKRDSHCVIADDFKALGPVPTETYQVIYALSPHGQFEVANVSPNGWRTLRGYPDCYVCFLPYDWTGKRVNRYVVPLSAAKRAK